MIPWKAEVTVDEVDIGKIKVGDTALITTDSLIGKEISGQIKAISPILELFGNSRAGKVVIGMDETDLPLRSRCILCSRDQDPGQGRYSYPACHSYYHITGPCTRLQTGRNR
jgi:hypothetical protein